MKHSTKMQFWLMFTPRQKPGGTCGLRIAWSISRFGDVVAEGVLARPAAGPGTRAGPCRSAGSAGTRARGSTGPRGACAARSGCRSRRGRRCSFAMHDRMIAAVQHVLFARPEQLDRRAGHLLGDQHRLRARSRWNAPRRPKPPPRWILCTSHLATGRPDAASRDRERGLAVLRRAPRPRTCPPCRARWRSSAPSGRGSGRDRCRPPRPSWRRSAIAALASPFWLPTKACSASRPSFSISAIVALETLAFGAFVPLDRQRVERGLGLPPGVGHDRDGVVADLHDLLHARHALDLGGVEALHLAAEHRAILDRGVEHARQLEVDAVDLLAGHLVERCRAASAACRRSSSPSDP